ncbi:hypothetical protein D3C71_1452330 [compost metagenome]
MPQDRPDALHSVIPVHRRGQKLLQIQQQLVQQLGAFRFEFVLSLFHRKHMLQLVQQGIPPKICSPRLVHSRIRQQLPGFSALKRHPGELPAVADRRIPVRNFRKQEKNIPGTNRQLLLPDDESSLSV